MHTPIPQSTLKPPKQVSFRQSLGGNKQTPPQIPPKVKSKPSTAKSLPIVGISA